MHAAHGTLAAPAAQHYLSGYPQPPPAPRLDLTTIFAPDCHVPGQQEHHLGYQAYSYHQADFHHPHQHHFHWSQHPQPQQPQQVQQPQQHLQLQQHQRPAKDSGSKRQRNNQSARRSRAKRRSAELGLAEKFAQLSRELYADLLRYWALLRVRDGPQPRATAAAELHNSLYYEGLCYGLREWHSARGMSMRVPLPWRGCHEDLSLWSGQRFMDFVASSETLAASRQPHQLQPGQPLHSQQPQQQPQLHRQAEMKWSADEAHFGQEGGAHSRWQPPLSGPQGNYQGVGSD